MENIILHKIKTIIVFLLKNSPLGILVIIKPSRIIIFIIIWNILCGLGILLNGGPGIVKKPASLAMGILATFYAAYCGFAPLISENIRNRWCRKNANFDIGQYGLYMLGLISGFLCLVAIITFIGKFIN